MRSTVFSAAVGGAVALMGFAGAANASATIDLIRVGSGTATTSILATSSSITLQVILIAGPAGSAGAGVSVDYSTVVGKLSVLGYASTPNVPSNVFPVSFGEEENTGSRVEGLNTVAFPDIFLGTGLPQEGQSAQIGTVTFHKDVLVNETFTITSDINGGADSILNFDGDVILDATFNSAFLMNVPEPGALSMLILGLGGLSLVGRGRRS